MDQKNISRNNQKKNDKIIMDKNETNYKNGKRMKNLRNTANKNK